MTININIDRIVAFVTCRDAVIDIDSIIKLAGGTNSEYGKFLRGPRAQHIVRCVNQHLKLSNQALVSEGIHSEQLQLVTVAEFHRRKAHFSLIHADNSYKNAYKEMIEIVEDDRASRTFRDHALAWVELFDEPETQNSRTILIAFSKELADKTEGQKTILKLVNIPASTEAR